MKKLVHLLLIALLLASCASIETANYYTDDLYYNNDVTHNFNTSAILNNENVAIPEDAVVYYDEEESSRINPKFEDRILAYEEEEENPTYFDENERQWSQPRSPHLMGGAGLLVIGGSYLISPYQTYQSPYYTGFYNQPYTHYGAGTSYIAPINRTPIVVNTSEPYRPNISSSRYEADRLSKVRQPIRPAAVQSGSSSSSKPSGYNSNASRKYKTESSSGGGAWSNPGYHNNSRTNTGSSSGSRSSGSVSGVRRR